MFSLLGRLFGGRTNPPVAPIDDDPMNSTWEPAGQHGRSKNFLPPYPTDLQIYAWIEAAGTTAFGARAIS